MSIYEALIEVSVSTGYYRLVGWYKIFDVECRKSDFLKRAKAHNANYNSGSMYM